MRWLKVLVVVMGVLIVAGTVTLVALLVQRAGSAGGTPRVGNVALGLEEGERIAGLAGAGERFAVQVERAGVSRILLLDQRGRVVGEVRER